jgi:hypothetical protein
LGLIIPLPRTGCDIPRRLRIFSPPIGVDGAREVILAFLRRAWIACFAVSLLCRELSASGIAFFRGNPRRALLLRPKEQPSR